jgi:hypothetical protein
MNTRPTASPARPVHGWLEPSSGVSVQRTMARPPFSLSTPNIGVLIMIALCLTAAAAWASERDQLWQHAYGGSAQDRGYDMAPTADGGMVLAGYTRSFGASGKDVYVVKVDVAGYQQWDAPLGTAARREASRRYLKEVPSPRLVE